MASRCPAPLSRGARGASSAGHPHKQCFGKRLGMPRAAQHPPGRWRPRPQSQGCAQQVARDKGLATLTPALAQGFFESCLLAKTAPATPTFQFPTPQLVRKGKPTESEADQTRLGWPGLQLPWQSVPADKGAPRCRLPPPLPPARIKGSSPLHRETQKVPQPNIPRAIRRWHAVWFR